MRTYPFCLANPCHDIFLKVFTANKEAMHVQMWALPRPIEADELSVLVINGPPTINTKRCLKVEFYGRFKTTPGRYLFKYWCLMAHKCVSELGRHLTPAQRSWRGVYWFHLIHLSICPSVDRIVSAMYLPQSVSYLHFLSSQFRRCVAFKDLFAKLKRIGSFGKFFNFCNFDFVLFWLGI